MLAMVLGQNIRRIYLALFGMALGGLLQPVLEPSQYFPAEPWKFGYGPPVALLMVTMVGWTCYVKSENAKWASFGIAALGIFSIYAHSRSLGGFLMLSALLIWLRQTNLGNKLSKSRINSSKLLTIALITGVSAFGILRGYEFAASNGWLGERAEHKFYYEYGNLGVIIGGRNEIVPGVHAVLDSPLIGYGSWARDPNFRFRSYLTTLSKYGYGQSDELDQYTKSLDLIPTHSTWIQAWVWAGILGAAFWVYIMVLMFRTGTRMFRRGNSFFAPSAFLLIWRAWDFFFSPFGSDMRFQWAISIIIFVNVINSSDFKKQCQQQSMDWVRQS